MRWPARCAAVDSLQRWSPVIHMAGSAPVNSYADVSALYTAIGDGHVSAKHVAQAVTARRYRPGGEELPSGPRRRPCRAPTQHRHVGFCPRRPVLTKLASAARRFRAMIMGFVTCGGGWGALHHRTNAASLQQQAGAHHRGAGRRRRRRCFVATRSRHSTGTGCCGRMRRAHWLTRYQYPVRVGITTGDRVASVDSPRDGDPGLAPGSTPTATSKVSTTSTG